jgi:hypothetical protein
MKLVYFVLYFSSLNKELFQKKITLYCSIPFILFDKEINMIKNTNMTINTNKYSLYFELLSQEETFLCLDLFKILCEPFIVQKDQWKCYFWSDGKINSVDFKDINALIEYARTIRFNEMNIHSKKISFNIPCLRTKKEITSFQFHVSPTSQIWSPVYGSHVKNKEDEPLRKTYESKEVALKTMGITQHPSLIEFFINIEENSDPNSIICNITSVIVKTLMNANLKISCLGGVNIKRYNRYQYYPNSITNLATWSLTYPMIGEKLDCLRPLTIAPISLCTKIKRALSLPDNAYHQCTDSLSLLRIPVEVIENDLPLSVSELLVPRNETTQYQPIVSGSGDYALPGGGIIRTRRRFNQLLDKKILPQLEEENTLFLLIPEQYCELMNIDPDNMLVLSMAKETARKLEEMLDQYFNDLTDIDDIKLKIWTAYENMLLKSDVNVTYFNLITELYFD